MTVIHKELIDLLTVSQRVIVPGLRGASSAWFAASLAELHTCCCIVADEHLVSVFAQDLNLFTNKRILQYPGHEMPPYTPLSPDQRTTADRLSTLYHIKDGGIMVTSVESLLRRVMPQALLMGVADYIMAGEDCDHNDLLHKLNYLGYEKVNLVQSVGEFSVRGGIVDIYPPSFMIGSDTVHEGPIRLDFFGETVESLRSFDPVNQRSTGEIGEAILLPVTDILFDASLARPGKEVGESFASLGEQYGWEEGETARLMERIASGHRFAGMEFFLPLFYDAYTPSCSSALDFLAKDATLVLVDPEGIYQNMDLILERIHTNYQVAQETAAPALIPEMLFLQQGEMKEKLDRFPQLLLSDFLRQDDRIFSVSSNDHQLLQQDIALKRSKTGLLAPLAEHISQWQRDYDRVIICCRSSRHTKNLTELLEKYGHTVEILATPLNIHKFVTDKTESRLFVCNHPLSHGFSLPDWKTHILSESELFGGMRLGGKSKKKQQDDPVRFTELNDGDIVVHLDHGLGIYRGLRTIEFQSIINDFMLIEYRGGDKLYLPVDRLNLISKYQGLSDRTARIDKLGTQNWKTAKAKIKEEVWQIAQELLHIYAKREIRSGRKFSPPGTLFHELEESFAFDETSGQAQSIGDVIQDLTSDKPMDRLVCGDVGYGKTEVAIRAAFKVVEDGYQVAILVPTTVLAEQHIKTFTERFQGFPVNINCLNRFRSGAKQRKIIKDIARGAVDIIIGTHRLLSQDVVFKNLGLLIIDEEHRFGVAHKERLKKMRSEVDVLTLTATPIPRTLQMSLLSIRDLSVISTPPEHRRPVKTFVARYDDLVIKEAVTKELRRGGQVFFVHNRVKSIHRMALSIQRLVPDAKIAIAHGQMVAKELEEIMVSFVNKDINVLVSTTIIESGLDIPSANTIVINRADMLGLAEIYQLRGRVGRSSVQSFAYLLVPSFDGLTKDTRKRLRSLTDYNELGGGFKLAMNDLQIRGGGNLLGISQSGNIAAIGYDLYLDLLQKTVLDLKAKVGHDATDISDETIDPEVHLQLSAYIPESYIPDINQRYIIYRRMAALVTSPQEMQSDLQEELVDRYGKLPVETLTLFRVIGLKKDLIALGIKKLEQGRDGLVFSFCGTMPLLTDVLIASLQKNTDSKKEIVWKITPDGRLLRRGKLSSIEHIFDIISTSLEELNKFVQTTN